MLITDWTEWQRDVADIIIEMFVSENKPDGYIFAPKELYKYSERLRDKWKNTYTITDRIRIRLKALVKYGVLQKIEDGQYKLVEGQYLDQQVKLLRPKNK